jgi:hypothetical protein
MLFSASAFLEGGQQHFVAMQDLTLWSFANNLPAPDILAAEIVADLEAALEQFREIATDLTSAGTTEKDSST